MKSKSDYSSTAANVYQYQAGSNRLLSVGLKDGISSVTFAYDDKGNQTHRNGNSEVDYNVFNKPTNIDRLGSQVSLFYDANWSRYKQIRVVDEKTYTTHCIDKLYEVEFEGSTSKATSYISDVALLIEDASDTRIRFTHKDRLGSSATFTDHNGAVTAYRSYDPFGKPKMSDGSLMSSFGMSARLANNLLDPEQSTRRGFTDHEHLDEVELIHMNGRVYDYNVGRFMGVDPFIQEPGNSQGINPYSYVMNNPLGYTDPSGYSAKAVCGNGGECNPEKRKSSQNNDKSNWVNPFTGQSYNGASANSNAKQLDTTDIVGQDGTKTQASNSESSANQSQSGWGIWDSIQTGLDVVGMVPIIGEVADFANAGISVARGDYEGAALSMAAMVPFVGNAAGAVKIARSADKAAEALAASKKGPDFIVGPSGATVSTSQARMRQSFSNMLSEKLPDGKGIKHHLPDGSIVRTMEPTNYAGRRASFTNKNGEPVNPFTGKPPQPPRGLTKAERKQLVRSRTHVEQDL